MRRNASDRKQLIEAFLATSSKEAGASPRTCKEVNSANIVNNIVNKLENGFFSRTSQRNMALQTA